MANPELNLCMGCMKKIGNDAQCLFCGTDTHLVQKPPFLPIKTIVGERYLIGLSKGHNGDGIDYIGWDLNQNTPVMLREFYPDVIAERMEDQKRIRIIPGCESVFDDCYQSFLELWRKLVRMRGLSALIVAFDIVEDNGTAYAVYEYTGGETLRDYLLKRRTGNLTWEQARPMFMPVLSTLGTLHTSGIVHRGISPTTLIVGSDGKLRISGFSIWQARTARGDLTAQLFPGYAALEQYGFKGQQGPWTDIYAFAAVLYRALVGSTPLEATARATNDKLMIPAEIVEKTPAYAISALTNALQILPEDRTHSVDQLRAELSAAPSTVMANKTFAAAPAGEEPPAPAIPKKPHKSSKAIALQAAGITIAICAVIAAIVLFTVFRDTIMPSNEETTPSEVQTQAVIRIPNFVGQSYHEISSNNYFLQIFQFEVTYEYSSTHSDGVVISQDLAPQENYLPTNDRTTINLVVSKGTPKVAIPEDIIGMDVSAATARLNALGFKNIAAINVDKDSAPGKAPGSVVGVTPVPSSGPVDLSTQIYLQIVPLDTSASTSAAAEGATQ